MTSEAWRLTWDLNRDVHHSQAHPLLRSLSLVGCSVDAEAMKGHVARDDAFGCCFGCGGRGGGGCGGVGYCCCGGDDENDGDFGDVD